MTTQEAVNTETHGRMSHALETAGKIAAAGVDFGLLKKKLEHAVEDAVLEAERMAKHSRHAVEDVVEDTTYCIKRIRGRRLDSPAALDWVSGCVSAGSRHD